MKKFLMSISIMACAVCFFSCGSSDSKEDSVKEFAVMFGRMVENHDSNGILDVYSAAEVTQPYSMEFNESKIGIFPDGDNRYRINYGQGKSIVVQVGLDNAVEVVSSEGIFGSQTAAAEETSSATPVAEESSSEATAPVETEAPAPVQEDNSARKKEFVARFKKNIKADSRWQDAGWKENSGDCYIYVNNKNSFPVDASDYYITFKYEYLYAEGMHSENVRKDGKALPANGKAKFTHYYTDDCSPLSVKVHFKLSDDQIWEKYGK